MRIIIFLLFILLLASGCKRCYICNAFITAPYRIDTVVTYGQIRYDTSGGILDSIGEFTTCDPNPSYHYGSYIQPFLTRTDTIIFCVPK